MNLSQVSKPSRGEPTKRIIVTGGSGFIGARVVWQLRKAGHNVLNVDMMGPDAEAIDIRDLVKLADIFGKFKPEFVFHIAGVANARVALDSPVKAVSHNIQGTATILEAARQVKEVKRVVLASTCWVANAMSNGRLDETSPFLPEGGGHVYTTTKIASELLCRDFEKLYGQAFTILRYGIPYGPGMWPGLVLRNFLDRGFAGEPLTIFGDGSASRKFLHVDDLAAAHVLVLQDVAENQVYNLEGMRFVSVQELAEMVAKFVDDVKIMYKEEPNRAGEFQYFRKLISSDKAYVELGWEPKIDLEEGVRQTVEWYKREMLSRRDMALEARA